MSWRLDLSKVFGKGSNRPPGKDRRHSDHDDPAALGVAGMSTPTKAQSDAFQMQTGQLRIKNEQRTLGNRMGALISQGGLFDRFADVTQTWAEGQKRLPPATREQPVSQDGIPLAFLAVQTHQMNITSYDRSGNRIPYLETMAKHGINLQQPHNGVTPLALARQRGLDDVVEALNKLVTRIDGLDVIEQLPYLKSDLVIPPSGSKGDKPPTPSGS